MLNNIIKKTTKISEDNGRMKAGIKAAIMRLESGGKYNTREAIKLLKTLID